MPTIGQPIYNIVRNLMSWYFEKSRLLGVYWFAKNTYMFLNKSLKIKEKNKYNTRVCNYQ